MSKDGVSPFLQLAHEAIDRLASPEVREQIIASALAIGSLRRVPDDAGSFGTFACGPLRSAINDALGEDAAEAVLADLSPAFAQEGSAASSGVRRRKRHSLPAPGLNPDVVILASEDLPKVEQVSQALARHAKLIVAADIFAALSAAHGHMTQPILLLMDDGLPSLRPSTMSTLARVLPSSAEVVLWGSRGLVPPAEWQHAGDLSAQALIAHARQWLEAETSPLAPRVLVADDDATWRTSLKRLLEAEGYDVVTAPDGLLALERCIQERPAAVLAGMWMGGIDGEQLASALITHFGEEGPPLILFSDAIELPEPPAGAVAVTRRDLAPSDVLSELSAWIGPGLAKRSAG